MRDLRLQLSHDMNMTVIDRIQFTKRIVLFLLECARKAAEKAGPTESPERSSYLIQWVMSIVIRLDGQETGRGGACGPCVILLSLLAGSRSA